jgi:hypothetical protein
MLKIKLKNNYYLIIQNGTTFNKTAEIWKEGFKFPFKEESFSDSVPLQEIVDWGNNNVQNGTLYPKA